MSSTDDFMSKLDAYIDMRIREHKPGIGAAEVARDRSTRAGLAEALEMLIRETSRQPADIEREQQNPGHH
jgi:hypothetical protein